MRVPLSWLGDYVDLPEKMTPKQLHAALVSVGFEEEDVHGGEVSGPVVVGQVLERTPEEQSNGKTINWCQVRVAPEGHLAADGGADVRGVVCGAHNFEVGDKVVVTLPGAVLPGGFAIAARKTYGHVSDGMIASVRELGIGEDHDGILVLARMGLDPEVGEDAKTLLGLDDSAVEINVTPDRGYAFSIRGVAREYSHATGAVFRDPALAVTPVEAAGFPLTVSDTAPLRGRAGVTTFVTRVVRGVDPARPSPRWLSSRLALAGIRSISLIVDITNYVMLELGNPIHGYDLDKLRGGMTVRRAEVGETLVTLDEHLRKLHPEDLLITDESGPIGLAGVMGGAATEIGDTTRNVLVEAAIFDPVSVARTARRHKLHSEASKRFERGVDTRVSAAAAQRVVDLLVELAGGTADTQGSVYDVSRPADPIDLPDGFIEGLVGVEFTRDEVVTSLTAIGAEVASVEGGLRVVPPTWRPDLTFPASLAEEVARIVGYDRIPSVLPVAPPGRGLTRDQKLRRSVARALADAGAVEVLCYPFVGEAANNRFGSPIAGSVPAIRLANPLDGEASYLRTSLIPGLIQAAQRNVSRGLTTLALYETGSVFLPKAGVAYGVVAVPPLGVRPTNEVLAQLNASIPPQPRYVSALLTGTAVAKQPGREPRFFDWSDALDVVRQISLALAVEITVRQGSHQGFHPGRTAELVVTIDGSERVAGYAGELLPAIGEDLKLPHRLAAVEANLDLLIEAARIEVEYVPLSSFPAATQDLSLLVSVAVPANAVLGAVVAGAGDLLESARLVDDYRGTGVEEGYKSLTFALRFRASDRTLTAAEANEAKLAGVAHAEQLFEVTLRD
ncbi:phenylalanine--tRNA ligase subunit beta [Klugiella xanthotipulae]|uniref:Phenylalanine--tRNA ligase beta subunit n=1 Tax=Klugiella xanthotipulae TaxID=244735 RepID=A0A543I3X7_9MICO|nr:phenylalanine--tRNA ligase subunit beta [Klugiella xanthotipulae]TQM65303.1 phenylalanyl-tRNA synthetase beta subunit [Klugiella xanthotipulae]